MEQNKSSVEILSALAKREGWDINIYEQAVSIRRGITNRIVIIKNPDYKGAYFILANTQSLSKYCFYSGIFYPITGHNRFHLHIRKRNGFDSLNFRKNKLRFKIGNNKFDSNVLVEANNEIEAHKFLSSSGIQYNILSYLKSANLLHIGVNELNPGFNKDLEGKDYLSVFKADEWMLDKDFILQSFKIAEQLKDKLTNL